MSTPAPSRTAELIARFDRPGPRYTSYPTAVQFHEGFGEADYRERLERADALGDAPLSMYVHLPFCEQRCLFCGCNVVITRHRDVSLGYLGHLEREIDLLAASLPNRRRVSQMHWGGGTPTYYAEAELERLFRRIAGHFTFTPDAEIGLEVDPRVTTEGQIARLRALGFNRLSMGVQDFDPDVQKAVRRIQSFTSTSALVAFARREGFGSTNVDLIYGLPHQTPERFRRTLDQVLEIRPERVAVYSFAHVPWLAPHMKYLPAGALPSPATKLELIGAAVDAFTGAGYRAIGMDHFAVPEDELSLALERRTLHRNFMGYTVQAAADMVGLGVSAIGDVQGAFAQNAKKLPVYYAAIEAGRFPIDRGVALDADDLLRRHVITRLMCDLRLDMRDVERRFDVSFRDTFARELEALAAPGGAAAEGLITIGDDALEVTPLGRMFVRNVCMTFDRYLRADAPREGRPVFSRTV